MDVARFRREGFLHVPGVLSADEVEVLGAAVDAAVARRKARDTRTLADKTPYEQSFIQCQSIWEDSPAVRPLTFHQGVGALAGALLGAERVRLWHDQALYKEPGGRETEAHQDHPYWPIAERRTLTAWIPLADTDETTGCMGYVPGSHLGEAQFVDIFRTPGAGEALKDRGEPVWVPAKAGDVIFHDGHTVHLARPNRSQVMRRVYTAILFADGCTRDSERPHPSVDRDRIAVGAPIAGPATPVVWPRTDFPEPAAWPGMEGERAKRLVEFGVIPGAPA